MRVGLADVEGVAGVDARQSVALVTSVRLAGCVVVTAALLFLSWLWLGRVVEINPTKKSKRICLYRET